MWILKTRAPPWLCWSREGWSWASQNAHRSWSGLRARERVSKLLASMFFVPLGILIAFLAVSSTSLFSNPRRCVIVLFWRPVLVYRARAARGPQAGRSKTRLRTSGMTHEANKKITWRVTSKGFQSLFCSSQTLFWFEDRIWCVHVLVVFSLDVLYILVSRGTVRRIWFRPTMRLCN